MAEFPMIDWVSAVIPCDHTIPIHGDKILRISPEGERLWEIATAKVIEGSYSDKITLKTHSYAVDGTPNMLYLSGNPAKWFQGHNLFGHGCPHELTVSTINRLCELLPELTPTPGQRKLWESGAFALTRVDVTSMFSLGSRAAVGDWLRSAEYSSRTRHGRPALKGGTLYWGKHSRRWALKAYGKAQEAERHKNARQLPASLSEWTDDMLRVELVLRQMELKQHEKGLDLAANWSVGDGVSTGLYYEYLSKLQMVDHMRIDGDALLKELPPRLAGTFTLWKGGYDLQSRMSRPTFYRHRKELLEYGVDITHKAPPRDRTNVVPLIRVVEAKPASIPDWVEGTDLMFRPQRCVS